MLVPMSDRQQRLLFVDPKGSKLVMYSDELLGGTSERKTLRPGKLTNAQRALRTDLLAIPGARIESIDDGLIYESNGTAWSPVADDIEAVAAQASSALSAATTAQDAVAGKVGTDANGDVQLPSGDILPRESLIANSIRNFFSVGKPTTGGVDRTATFKSMAAKLAAAGGGLFYIPYVAGGHIITETISLPANVSIYQEPYAQVIPQLKAGNVNGFTQIGTTGWYAAFMINTTDGQTWTTEYPATRGTKVENLYVNNVTHKAALPIVAVSLGASAHFENIRTAYCLQVWSVGNEYLDKVSFNKSYIHEPYSDYAIKLRGIGDGWVFQQIHCFSETSVSTSGVNCKAVSLTNTNGAFIVGCIGGKYEFINMSCVTIDGIHNETDNINFVNSGGEVRNSYFWLQNDTAADRVIKCTGASGHRNVSVENCVFVYNLNIGKPFRGYEIGINARTILTVKNCYRQISRNGVLADSQLVGIQVWDEDTGVPLTDWNDDSYVLSQKGRIEMGRRVVKDQIVPVTNTMTPTAIGTFLQAITANSQAGTWTVDNETTPGSAATYFYKAVVLSNVPRMLGRTSNEQSVSLTLNGSGALIPLVWSRYPQGTIRLYRGTASGRYDHYVDIPAIACRILFDNGTRCNSFEWKPFGFRGTGTVTGSVLTIETVVRGTLAVGDTLTIPNVPANTYVVSLGTGTGGTGTYNLSAAATGGVPSGSIVGQNSESNSDSGEGFMTLQNSLATWYASAIPAGRRGTFQVGDRVLFLSPAKGGQVGAIYTGTAWESLGRVGDMWGKGTTAQRPATLTAAQAGYTYLDTTLVAAGKPIFWTGTAWVDSAGAAA